MTRRNSFIPMKIKRSNTYFTGNNMKIILLLILLQTVGGNEYAVYSENELLPSTNTSDEKDMNSNLLEKWLQLDGTLKGLAESLVRNLFPLAFQLITTASISPNCTGGIVQLFRGIVETKLWAFKMMDSSGKLPNGIMQGNVFSLGDYESCLDIESDSIKGRYCLLGIDLPLPKKQILRPIDLEIPDFQKSLANDTVISEVLKNIGYWHMFQPRTSICIPSTCNETDVQNMVAEIKELFNLNFGLNVKSCETKDEEVSISLFDKTLIFSLISVFSVVIIGTIIDAYLRMTSQDFLEKHETLSQSTKCLLNFSLYTNTIRLLKNDDNPDSIRVFYGMRVISTLWIILGHTYRIIYPQVYGGFVGNKDIPKEFWFQFISNANMAVETLFFMSSVLLAYYIIKTKESDLSIGGVFVKRYIRTTIPHFFVIACVCLLPFLSYGPLSKEIIGEQAENCKVMGWLNMFYVNNYVPFPKMCLSVTWFLAVDAQLFLLSLFVLIPFKNKPKVIFLLIGILMVCGILATVLSHLIHGLPPTMLSIYLQLEDVSYILERSQFRSHFHLPTYCVGLTVGYILATKKNVHVPKNVNVILWTASLAVVFGILFGTYDWNKEGITPGLFVSIIYGSAHRLLWSLALSWITIACYFKNGGAVSRFLGSAAFVPLSRLSNMAYLTHLIVKFLYIGTITSTIVYNHRTNIVMFFAITTITFVISGIMTLFFESPFISLQKGLVNKLMDRKVGKGK